jgi:chorismate-pyruvate lyase
MPLSPFLTENGICNYNLSMIDNAWGTVSFRWCHATEWLAPAPRAVKTLATHRTDAKQRPDFEVCDSEGRSAVWPSGFNARVQALALLQTLNVDLLTHNSATLTLERWCETHKLASPAIVVAERMRDVDKAPTDEVRRLLNVNATALVRYRRVRLHCGEHVLSEADNWYVPTRLTPDINRSLDTTDTAFGRAVQTLHFRRQTLSAKLLWSPLPEGWEMGVPASEIGTGRLPIPYHVIEHRAVLSLPSGTPFSVVVETYTGELFAPLKPRPCALPGTPPER